MVKYAFDWAGKAGKCFRLVWAQTEESPMQAGSVIKAKLMALNSFLRRVRYRFWSVLRRRFDRKPTSELLTLTRFVFHRDHYSKGCPKPGAFLPPRDKYAISMLFTDGLEDEETWRIGDEVGKDRGKSALARATLSKSSVTAIGLSVELSPGVHPNHADVGGWPKEKHEQKLIALDLCAKSTLRLRSAGGA